MTIFHNGRCSKSRGALEILQERGLHPEIRYYLMEPPSPEELGMILKKLGIKAEQLIRKNEKIFKEEFKGKKFDERGWLKVLSENPRLIQRPIVINEDKAVIARPPEKVLEIL